MVRSEPLIYKLYQGTRKGYDMLRVYYHLKSPPKSSSDNLTYQLLSKSFTKIDIFLAAFVASYL